VAWSALLVAHVAAAAVAVPLGAYNLLRRPRGDALHRALGYAWAALMAWVASSSFWIRELEDGAFSWIHGLSVLTLATLALGVYHGVRRHRRAHRGNMVGTYLGLIGALAGAVAVPDRAVPRLAAGDPLAFTAAVALAFAVAAVVVLAARWWTRRAAA
jgi:uncharacterized membrane protein